MQRPTVESLLRSTQAYCSLFCEKSTLEHGIAYFARRFPRLSEAHQFREIVAETADAAKKAVDEATAFFAQEGFLVGRWAPAAGTDVGALTTELLRAGWVEKRCAALHLRNWPDAEPQSRARIVPARAVRGALAELITASMTGADSALVEASVAAQSERLDSAQYDLFVALVDGVPCGRCALLQVGDFARVVDHLVLPAHAGSGADRALLLHVLSLAKRLAMRTVLTQVDASDGAELELMRRVNFEEDGVVTEFIREPAVP